MYIAKLFCFDIFNVQMFTKYNYDSTCIKSNLVFWNLIYDNLKKLKNSINILKKSNLEVIFDATRIVDVHTSSFMKKIYLGNWNSKKTIILPNLCKTYDGLSVQKKE